MPKFSTHVIHSEIEEHISSLDNDTIKVEPAGNSFEGRSIRLLSAGNGKRTVMAWTQMHGDESTATKAVFDVLNFLTIHKNEPEAGKILSELSLFIIPMLNPDGAECRQRRNAQGLDINRDAERCMSFESRILHGYRLRLRPEFGFNLHDQELSTVATTKEITALALLAPAYDEQKGDNETRTKAKQVASVITEAMREFVPNNLARYGDDFEPRAFGDTFQKCNVSTVLIEAGHAKQDYEKKMIRKLYAISLLASLYAIAANEISGVGIAPYEGLPFNGKKAYDVILRNAIIKTVRNETFTADVAISYQVDTHSEFPPKIVDLGDLSTFTALHDLDASTVCIMQNVIAPGTLVNVELFHSLGVEFPAFPW